MAKSKAEQLGSYLERATSLKSKDKRVDATIKRVEELDDIEYVKTGNIVFDKMIGGFPRGRFSLMYGGPGVGKSSFVAQVCGHVVNPAVDQSALIFEPENRADKTYMRRFMDTNKVFISQNAGLGIALDNLIKIVKSGKVDIVFVDSLAALAAKEIKSKSIEGDHMALVARRMPQFFQEATEVVADTKTAIVFVHQMRHSLDMFTTMPETFNGGNALKHQVSLVLHMRRASTRNDPDKGNRFEVPNSKRKSGHMTNFKCLKGGIGTITEGDSIQVDFFKNYGFVDHPSVANLACRNNIIAKEGNSKYIFTDAKGKFEQTGIQNMYESIAQDKDLSDRILESCRRKAANQDLSESDPDYEYEKDITEGNNSEEEKKSKE